MPKFLVIHPLSTPITQEEANQLGREARAVMTPDVQWICSWCQLNDEGKLVKIYCEWEAQDAESVNTVLSRLPMLPVEGIYRMMRVEPKDLGELISQFTLRTRH